VTQIISFAAPSHQKFSCSERDLYQQKDQTMGVIFILICASITVAGGFLVAFLWAVKNGQFEDNYTPSVRMLFEEDQNKMNKNDE
jgi:cbb3-type cytochrome oxidase maturation protein